MDSEGHPMSTDQMFGDFHYAPVVEDGRVRGVISVELISRAIREDA